MKPFRLRQERVRKRIGNIPVFPNFLIAPQCMQLAVILLKLITTFYEKEATALQALGVERHADAVMPDDLDEVASGTSEDV